jgi:hypothetical protein
MDYLESIIRGEDRYRNHKEICKERWNENNKIVLTNEKIIVDNKINFNYVRNYQLGYLSDTPPVKNAESRKRLLEFASDCLSEKAPLSQGYYFKNEENILQFIRAVVLVYLGKDVTHFGNTWYHMDSVKIVDNIMSNKMMYYSFNEHELFFVVNSYNRDCHSKKHKILYRIVNDIMVERERFCNKTFRTFILSLTHDVGRDKGSEHGFPIPMFHIKDKIKEVLEAKENGNNPWRNSKYKLEKVMCFFAPLPSFY